jgi:glycine C-acetyltransferase
MKPAYDIYAQQLKEIEDSGLWKTERIIESPQRAWIDVGGRRALNLCANNYLGLSDHPRIIEAAKKSYGKWGHGLSSVRFICGTQALHKQLEEKLAAFLGMEDAILYSSCFDANGGLFETLLSEQDAIISDQLNHASIIDGIRLSRAQRYRYANNNMEELESRLKEANASGARIKMIATDGVFSMDGFIANLKGICDLADRHGALVMVDDSHAVGFMGKHGRGTPEYCGVSGRVDILTGTFGKALGGASGGYAAAKKTVVDLLRQRSRPYLFSNTLAPAIASSALEALDMLTESTELRDKLEENTKCFRAGMKKLGFDIPESEHPIAPIMLYDARRAQELAAKMLEKGVYVIGFFYPVVPKDRARIRVQISAAHTKEDLDFAMRVFAECRAEIP